MQELILSTDFSPQAYFQKARALADEGAIAEALQAIDAAIIFSHSSAFYIYQKMKLLFSLGAYESCSDLIISQLEYLYQNASLYLLCRFIDFYQKINPTNLTELRLILENSHIPYCLAYEYEDLLYHPHKALLPLAKKANVQDRHKLCISYCELIAKTREFSPDVIYLKAYSYRMLGNLIKARLYYMDLISLTPNHALAHHHLGLILMEEGFYLDAIKSLQKATELAPDNVDYFAYLAECHCRFKHYEEAATIYESLHKAFPDDLQIYFNLSYTYKKSNKKFLSYKYAKKAKKMCHIK